MQDQIQKLLLMGPGGAGKTCMRSIIFDNYLPRDALRVGITISLDQSQVRMFNNLYLSLWDCGGQHRYVAEYLNRQKEYIFRSVTVMLFVFDINSMSRESNDAYGGMSTNWSRPEMLEYFQSAMHFIRQYSPQAKIFVLLHKMDLIAKEHRESIFELRKAEILSRIKDTEGTSNIQFFATSIWSDSLYFAYSSVVRSLVPRRDILTQKMKELLTCCNAAQVALYERNTFLCLTHVSRKDADDIFTTDISRNDNNGNYIEDGGGGLCFPTCELRTTEVSEVVKHFKLSCMNNTTSLDGFQITTESFTALLHPFTNSTHVLLVSTDPSVSVELHKCNVCSAQRAFEQFLRSGNPAAEEMRQADMDNSLVVAGHAVRSPSLVSVGGDGKWMAYGCSANMILVCSLLDSFADSHDDLVLGARMACLDACEKLSVVQLHRKKELLCVGTAHHGLYLTTASCPTLGHTTTRLPLRLTGENVFSACFIDGYEKGADVLVASCGSHELVKGQFKLSMWDTDSRSLLWRGCADSLDTIVPLPGTFGFASSSAQQGITLWTVEQQCGSSGVSKANGNNNNGTTLSKESTTNIEGGADGKRFTVLSKPCSIVNELRDAEFVSIIPPEGPGDFLVALSTVGFLVSFDCRSGMPVKWMDCKVFPATAAYRIGDDIVVCGALIRFFSSLKWEFHGKIKNSGCQTVANSSSLTRLMDLLCTGAAVFGKGRVMFFFSGGDMSRYRVVQPKIGASRLSFHHVYQYTPVMPGEAPLRWIFLSGKTEGLCLWSPRRLRLYDTKFWKSTIMNLESTCTVYHSGLGVLLAYESSAYEIVAIMPKFEFELCRLTVAEPLTCLAAHEENQFVGLSLDNSLFYFKGQWEHNNNNNSNNKFILQRLNTTRLTGFKAPLTQLVSVGTALCAASAHVVANLKTEKNVNFHDDIIGFTISGGGNMLLVAHHHCCLVLDSSTLQCVGEPIQVPRLKEVVASPTNDLIALRCESEVFVVRLTDRHRIGRISFQRDADNTHSIAILSLGFTFDGKSLVFSDSRGLLRVHKIADMSSTAKEESTTKKVVAETVGNRKIQNSNNKRVVPRDGPTSMELESRFVDLHGFYESTRRSQKKRGEGQKRSKSLTSKHSRRTSPPQKTTLSSSGVLILLKGDSILQIPSGSENQELPLLRKWESDSAPVELPRVICSNEDTDVCVSTSVVEVSALTSVDSMLNFNLHTVTDGKSALTSPLAADPLVPDTEKNTSADGPVYGVQSPARKGEAAISPPQTPEDDVVNIESIENEDLQHRFNRSPVVLGAAPPTSMSTASNASSSVRMKSLEIRDALRELAGACEQQGQDGVVEAADTIDPETLEEMFNTVSRLYVRQQSQQQQRPGSAGSIAGSDISSVSFNVIMADLQRLQRQNGRIEAQNVQILTKLGLR